MTQHKVIAEDSLSAMDEISKILGKNAVILETNKVNGKIEIIGSNSIQDVASSNAKKKNKQKSSFSHLFSNHKLEQGNQNRKLNSIVQEDFKDQTELNTSNIKVSNDHIDKNTFLEFTSKIENLLENTIISDLHDYGTSQHKSLTIELLKRGFSKKIISQNNLGVMFNSAFVDLPAFLK